MDPARDLAYVARAAQMRDVQTLKKRLEELKRVRAGLWVVAETEAMDRAREWLEGRPFRAAANHLEEDDPGVPAHAALRLGSWSREEVAWLSRLDLMTDKAWVLAVNCDLRRYLLGRDYPVDIKEVRAEGLKLGVAPNHCFAFSAAFERRLQQLKEAPTVPPSEDHLPTVSPYDASPAARDILCRIRIGTNKSFVVAALILCRIRIGTEDGHSL